MKNVSLDVQFKSPEKALQEKLRENGARDISIRRTFGNRIEVRYTIEVDNPQEQIESLIEKYGAKDVRSSSSYNGARFSFKLDDLIDEREFKKQIIDTLRRSGFRAN